MKLICAGMSKTGTKSVASALRVLGYTVYDAEEHWKYHLDEYVDALEGKQLPDFATMYANVDAVVDSPSYFFWEEISAAFPNAKVLLMVRDSEEIWLESLKKTMSIISSVRSSPSMRLGFLCTPTGRKWRKRSSYAYKKAGVNPDTFVIEDSVDKYRAHNARVQSSIPRDQLLVYNVKQGWKPLCDFLGVEVPDVPFPRLNVKSQSVEEMFYSSRLYTRMCIELITVLTVIVLIGAHLSCFLLN